jgi:hypothetical protein
MMVALKILLLLLLAVVVVVVLVIVVVVVVVVAAAALVSQYQLRSFNYTAFFGIYLFLITEAVESNCSAIQL